MPNNVIVVIWACDLNGRLTFIADNIEDLLGYTATEIMQAPAFSDSGRVAFRSALAEESTKTAPPFSSKTWKVLAKKKDGTEVPLLVVTIFERDDSGMLARIVGTAQPAQCPLCLTMRELSDALHLTLGNLVVAVLDA